MKVVNKFTMFKFTMPYAGGFQSFFLSMGMLATKRIEEALQTTENEDYYIEYISNAFRAKDIEIISVKQLSKGK